MFYDARTEDVPSDVTYDVCIIGAGAAGIALALEFSLRRNKRICMLEGGDLEYDDASQELYQGDVIGRDYADLDAARLRYFGGTTNHWAGYCLPFSENSFERCPWIPHSGWPITREDVSPYYERARALLELPDDGGWNPASGWSAEALERDYGSPRLGYISEHYFRHNVLMLKPLRMGERYGEPLREAGHIDVFLNANVVEIEVDELGELATGAHVRTLSGRAFTVRAKFIVLAAGGLENARLLLSSTAVQSQGLGNGHGLVGRFFADHINIRPGSLIPANPGVNLELYLQRSFKNGADSIVWYELSPATQERFELIPASVRLRGQHEALSSPGGQSLRSITRDLGRRRLPADVGTHLMNVLADLEPLSEYAARYLWYGNVPISEIGYEMSLAPAPNRDSRVTLGDKRDALGMRRLRLDWRLSEIDFKTIRWAVTAFADESAANGFGRSKLELDDDFLSDNIRYTWHHMCTTRMSASASTGVVDSDCCVHAMKNLYLAGSSVFSTAGWGSPTFLIVALAQRLGDHLTERMAA